VNIAKEGRPFTGWVTAQQGVGSGHGLPAVNAIEMYA